jgi:hypothetical protein
MVWRGLMAGLAVVSFPLAACAQSAPPGWFDGIPKPLATPGHFSISCAVPAKPADQAKPTTYEFAIDTVNQTVVETDGLSPGGIKYSNEPLTDWDPHASTDADRSKRFVSVGRDEISWGLRILRELRHSPKPYSAYLAAFNLHTHKLTETRASLLPDEIASQRANEGSPQGTYDIATYTCKQNH